jgi:hypothetical protein
MDKKQLKEYIVTICDAFIANVITHKQFLQQIVCANMIYERDTDG